MQRGVCTLALLIYFEGRLTKDFYPIRVTRAVTRGDIAVVEGEVQKTCHT